MKNLTIGRQRLPEMQVRVLEDKLLIKPYSIKDLCTIYSMSYKVMRRALSPIATQIGEKSGRLFNVYQVEIIIQFLGWPYTLARV